MAHEHTYDDLPQDIRDRIDALYVGKPGPEWVQLAIPALDGRTVLELYALPGGADRVRDFLLQLEARFL